MPRRYTQGVLGRHVALHAEHATALPLGSGPEQPPWDLGTVGNPAPRPRTNEWNAFNHEWYRQLDLDTPSSRTRRGGSRANPEDLTTGSEQERTARSESTGYELAENPNPDEEYLPEAEALEPPPAAEASLFNRPPEEETRRDESRRLSWNGDLYTVSISTDEDSLTWESGRGADGNTYRIHAPGCSVVPRTGHNALDRLGTVTRKNPADRDHIHHHHRGP